MSQQVQTAPGRADDAGVCLELRAPRTEVQLGEPFSVVASLVNCSSTPQQVEDLLSPEFGFLQIWIQPPDGAEKLYRPIVNREGRGAPTRTLAPGERLSALVPVYMSADGWMLTQPGQYRFRAQYAPNRTRVESKPVEVTVVPPQSRADRDAASLIMSPEASRFLATGRDDNGEGRKRLTLLTREYSESGLAPYAQLALASADSVDRFDPSTKSFEKGRCEGTVVQFGRLVSQVGDPSLAARGTAAWLRCLRQLGREKEESAAVSTLLKAHPTTREVSTVMRTLDATRRD